MSKIKKIEKGLPEEEKIIEINLEDKDEEEEDGEIGDTPEGVEEENDDNLLDEEEINPFGDKWEE